MDRKCGFFFVLLAMATLLAGCRSNIIGSEYHEYHEDFAIDRSVAEVSAISIADVNGSIILTGKNGLTGLKIVGRKTVEANSYEDAKNHIGDIEVDTLTLQEKFSVMTTQPNSSSGRTYRVDYDVTIPTSWGATVSNINGTVAISGVNGGVGVSLTNGLFDAENMNGNLKVNLTNGNISTKLSLPDSGNCELRTLNGNILLWIPGSTSATLSASVVNGSVGISGLTIATTSSTRTQIQGTMGSGRGRIMLSTVNGVIQLVGI